MLDNRENRPRSGRARFRKKLSGALKNGHPEAVPKLTFTGNAYNRWDFNDWRRFWNISKNIFSGPPESGSDFLEAEQYFPLFLTLIFGIRSIKKLIFMVTQIPSKANSLKLTLIRTPHKQDVSLTGEVKTKLSTG